MVSDPSGQMIFRSRILSRIIMLSTILMKCTLISQRSAQIKIYLLMSDHAPEVISVTPSLICLASKQVSTHISLLFIPSYFITLNISTQPWLLVLATTQCIVTCKNRNRKFMSQSLPLISQVTAFNQNSHDSICHTCE